MEQEQYIDWRKKTRLSLPLDQISQVSATFKGDITDDRIGALIEHLQLIKSRFAVRSNKIDERIPNELSEHQET